MSQIYVDNIKGRTGGAVNVPSGIVVTGISTLSGDVSIGGTLTYEDVSNIDSVGVITARGGIQGIGIQSGGVNIAVGVITALNFIGTGNTFKVTGTTVDISIQGGSTGSGSTSPRIVAFNPEALTTGVSTTTNITITFDKDIKTAGTGDILIKSGSSSGTTLETLSITNGTPGSGISTSGTQLIINPTSDLPPDTNIFVILPNDGIQGTDDIAYDGSDTYNFRTAVTQFTATGGTDTFTLTDSNSPTGYYRYHVFQSSGSLVTGGPSDSSPDLKLVLIAGGGGGASGGGGGGGAGGVIARTQSDLSLDSGTYTVTIGAGGTAGELKPPNTPHSGTQNVNTGFSGEDSTITPPSSPTTYHLRAFGGGGGRMAGAPIAPVATASEASGVPGGSGGGISGMAYPTLVADITVGSGTPGQGNNGGDAPDPTDSPNSAFGSGGGGGAGGAGGNGTNPGSPPYRVIAGAGGNGTPHPEFNTTNLNSSSLPASVLTEIGPTGLYGGGGGGGVCFFGDPDGPFSAYTPSQSSGGPGGGGNGGPYPITNDASRHALDFTGGGGGGGSYYRDSPPEPDSSRSFGGDGGKGIMILRYASPSS